MKKEKLGTIGLTAVILSAIIGGGVYDLPKNMAVRCKKYFNIE